MPYRQIDVLFIDASTGEVFAQTRMSAENLPRSFEPQTTLHIGEQDWNVVNAEPATADQFTRTGKLTLTVERIQFMRPQDLLFTLPTICDEIPHIADGTTKRGKRLLELHEDDWRQIELISNVHQQIIDAEFADIARIFKEHSVNNGQFLAFKNVHVRQRIREPLPNGLTLAALKSLLPEQHETLDGVAYLQSDGLLTNGFAFGLGELSIYGQQVDGRVAVLGIQRGEGAVQDIAGITTCLARIMFDHQLSLVDWCRMQRVPASVASMTGYLAR